MSTDGHSNPFPSETAVIDSYTAVLRNGRYFDDPGLARLANETTCAEKVMFLTLPTCLPAQVGFPADSRVEERRKRIGAVDEELHVVLPNDYRAKRKKQHSLILSHFIIQWYHVVKATRNETSNGVDGVLKKKIERYK